MLKTAKEKFIRDLHFGGTVSGAFQRSSVYVKDASDPLKRDFRKALRIELETMEKKYRNRPVKTKAHLKHIEQLRTWSEDFGSILSGSRLNFGIAQKILNIHLKGIWCLGELNYPPPHFPVDRIIQIELGLHSIVAWTKMEDEHDYLRIIKKAEDIAEGRNLSLAELELQLYNHAMNDT